MAASRAVDQDYRDVGVTRPPTPSISDDELTALALAADPDAPLADDAEPWVTGDGPAACCRRGTCRRRRPRRRRHRAVVALIVGALLVVNGAGLCVTYGFPEIAW